MCECSRGPKCARVYMRYAVKVGSSRHPIRELRVCVCVYASGGKQSIRLKNFWVVHTAN